MKPSEWNAVLAPHIPWQEAYAAVAREARAYLVIAEPRAMTTTELADALYSPLDAKTYPEIVARKRIFSALSALAKHDLADCCTRGAARTMGRMKHVIRPWLWHSPKGKVVALWDDAGDYRIGDRVQDANGRMWECVLAMVPGGSNKARDLA